MTAGKVYEKSLIRPPLLRKRCVIGKLRTPVPRNLRVKYEKQQSILIQPSVVHGEMFPLVNNDKPNPLRFFQIWLNLPKKSKMVDPDFVMHWAHDVKKVETKTKSRVTVWAGDLMDHTPEKPPKNSYAADSKSQVGVWLIEIDEKDGLFSLPGTKEKINRCAYFIEGEKLDT
eukprot:UN08848